MNWSESENEIVRGTELKNEKKWVEWKARAKEKSKIKGRNKSTSKNLPSVAELSHSQNPQNDECEAKIDKEDMLGTRQKTINDLREDINIKAYKSVIPPSKSVIKMMNKIYRKLEESV